MVKTITKAMAQQHMQDLLDVRLKESGYTPLSFQMWREQEGEKLWHGHAKAARKLPDGSMVWIQSLEWLDDAWVSLDVVGLNTKAMAALCRLVK